MMEFDASVSHLTQNRIEVAQEVARGLAAASEVVWMDPDLVDVDSGP